MLYAAYGSNLHPLRLRERVASARLVASGFVPGWDLRFHKRSRDGSGKCNIVSGGEGVYVAIFDICGADKVILDRIEGVGMGYVHHEIDVSGVGHCATYVAQTSHIDDSLVPYDWYRELVLLGARTHAFPRRYVEGIAAVQSRTDPDEQRAAGNRRTLAAISNAHASTRWADQQ